MIQSGFSFDALELNVQKQIPQLSLAHGNNPFSRHASATRPIAMLYAAVR